MVIVLAWINAFIFFALALLHFYWANGGKWGIDKAVPVAPSGEKVLKPSALASIVVAIGLSLMAIVHLNNARLFSIDLQFPVNKIATLAIALIFLLRSIGDFKWVGLFKKVRDTEFGRSDTKYFIPLCLFLSLSAFLIYSRA